MMERYNPLKGHVAIITAFNFPCAVFFWNAALSLVAGNTQVLYSLLRALWLCGSAVLWFFVLCCAVYIVCFRKLYNVNAFCNQRLLLDFTLN